MNLHRTEGKSDWEKVPENERNVWQRVAAKTNGIVTPGNAVTAAGAGLVLSGVHDINRGRTHRGIVKVALGRLFDIGDGFVAEKTKTKSRTGAFFDAFVDKLEVGVALPVLAKKDIIPRRAVKTIVIQNAANVVFTGIAKARGRDIDSSLAGKYTTTAQWTEITLGGITNILKDGQNNHEVTLQRLNLASEVVATGLGLLATAGYAETALDLSGTARRAELERSILTQNPIEQ